jgi:type IV pilus assembly protein PilC
MIVFLGFTIGAIVISLFLPLIKLLEGLSKSG